MNKSEYKILEHLNPISFSNNRYMEIVKDWDSTGFIDKTLGEELQSIIDSEDYVLGIHRTGCTRITPDIKDYNLKNIFSHGLYNNGDFMSGANNGKYDIEKTVSLIRDPLFLGMTLKTVDDYKNSNGCVVVKIPKSYIGEKSGNIMPIYYLENSLVRLCPEFIYGYIPVVNHRAEKIIRNPNYKDQHYTINENSAYDQRVSSKYNNLPSVNKISLKEKYDILCKAYIDTLKKYGDNQAITALFKIIEENNFMYFTGVNNKKLLSQHIIFSDIRKILCFGLNMETNEIGEVINLFHLSMVNQISENYNKNTK